MNKPSPRNLPANRVTVLAISSGGGHWLQLTRMAPAFEGQDLITACTADGPSMDVEVRHHQGLREATRWNRWGLLVLGAQVGRLVLRERPAVVITTGAAPGLWALFWGRWVGARTIWIDSLANVRHLSAAGRLARWLAHEWWTQWRHLAEHGPATREPLKPRGRRPEYRGAVW